MVFKLCQSAESRWRRLQGYRLLADVIKDPSQFIYTYVRKEALLSSQIEGTQSSLSDLLLFELDEVQGGLRDDVVEVSNYVAALDHGLSRLRSGFPLSGRLLREIHAVLLSRGRGSGKDPGNFRRSQNWTGGVRPGAAAFVPPPHLVVPDSMGALERFLNGKTGDQPILLRAGLAHVQFETIHPFLDGNGRLGRLLITLILCEAGMLKEPLLYLSLYLKHHRSTYYELLSRVREVGDWEAWLDFFLSGIEVSAAGAVSTAHELSTMFAADRAQIEAQGRRAGSVLRVHQALKARPLLSISNVCQLTDLSFPTASSAMELLIELSIAREVTGNARNRLFAYSRYLLILSEGTEPL
nr:uncharacterized protein NMB0459-like [Nerophis lumbriciformis]